MKISEEQLRKLEDLSNISLSSDEKKLFLDKMDAVIGLLEWLKSVSEISSKINDKKTLDTISGVEEYGDSKWLLDNVEHEIVNNSIVVKSVLR